jgi:uncharacterized SAM-binding protein YcdF (DUF218 family)
MFFGLFSRRERWGLSARGGILVTVLALAAPVAFALTIHPFLALTSRATTDYLVVEGWIHDRAIQAATVEFRDGGYREVFATGGPVSGMGDYINDYSTAANIGAHRLRRHGVPPERVHAVPSRVKAQHRTYQSAVALRDWLEQNAIAPDALNVVTEGVHARRTRLLFQRALGPQIKVGIVALQNPDYHPGRWWRYSEGVRDVLGETIAYVYARLFFHPSPTLTAAPASPPESFTRSEAGTTEQQRSDK